MLKWDYLWPFLDWKTLIVTGCSHRCETKQGWERWGNCNSSFRNWGKLFRSQSSVSDLCDSFMSLFLCKNQNLKDGAAAAVEHLREAESEAKSLRSKTQRMILTQEEMVCLLILKWDLLLPFHTLKFISVSVF